MEKLLTHIRCNRRYLMKILSNLGQDYRSGHSIRLHRINEGDKFIAEIDEVFSKPASMEVDS